MLVPLATRTFVRCQCIENCPRFSALLLRLKLTAIQYYEVRHGLQRRGALHATVNVS